MPKGVSNLEVMAIVALTVIATSLVTVALITSGQEQVEVGPSIADFQYCVPAPEGNASGTQEGQSLNRSIELDIPETEAIINISGTEEAPEPEEIESPTPMFEIVSPANGSELIGFDEYASVSVFIKNTGNLVLKNISAYATSNGSGEFSVTPKMYSYLKPGEETRLSILGSFLDDGDSMRIFVQSGDIEEYVDLNLTIRDVECECSG